MKRFAAVILSFVLLGTIASVTPAPGQENPQIKAFWEKFSSAVTKGDKATAATLSEFPIGMSFGIPKIRTRAQLMKYYHRVFNEQADATKCFATAHPEFDTSRPKEFTIPCRDAAGNQVVIYTFRLTPNGWRFVSLDNLNE